MRVVAPITSVLVLLAFSAALDSQANPQSSGAVGGPQAKADEWGAFRFLLGDWVGEGSGQPGEGSGTFSFRFDLENKVLVRRDHSEYPAAQGRPAIVHDGLMIVYPRPGHDGVVAIYFDNEGHVIQYQVGVEREGNTVVFVSEPAAAAPRFRLSYDRMTNDTVNVEFEIAPPGQPDAFKRYVSGRSRRVTRN